MMNSQVSVHNKVKNQYFDLLKELRKPATSRVEHQKLVKQLQKIAAQAQIPQKLLKRDIAKVLAKAAQAK